MDLLVLLGWLNFDRRKMPKDSDILLFSFRYNLEKEKGIL
jgi:hypothetical protein